MRNHVLLYGLVGGLLIALLKLIEYRWLIVAHSVQIYGALIAALFAALGIWLGQRLTHRPPAAQGPPAQAPEAAAFVRDAARLQALAITRRELQILELMAAGLSNKELAARLCVSENTVKTHLSRVFDKLGARRRTQAVQLAKAQQLIP